MIERLIKQKNISKFSFILLYILIWFSLDTNFESSLLIFEKINFKNLILLIRSLAPFIIFLFIFVMIYLVRNKTLLNNNDKNLNYIYLIFLFFLLIQLLSHFISKNETIFIYYFFLSFFLIFYFYHSINYNLLDVSFYISITVLFVLFLIFGYLSLKHFFTNGDLHFYGTFPNVYKSILTVSTNVIRSSGLSRTTMLIYIPLFVYLLITPISKTKFTFNFFLIFIILLTQSRLTSMFWVIFLFLISLWFLRDNKFTVFLNKILILIILPFLITGAIISIKYSLILNKIILVDHRNAIVGIKIFVEEKNYTPDFGKLKKSDKAEEEELSKQVIIRTVDPSTYSSGRLNYWKQILDRNESILIGNGYLGDRFILDSNNASNILFYTYASGGILCIILMMFLILRCFYTCFDLMFIKKINFEKKNIITITSIFYLAFLTFRGIGENSYAVFSIDQIIFLQSLIIIEMKRNTLLKK